MQNTKIAKSRRAVKKILLFSIFNFENEIISVTLDKCMRYYEIFPTTYACHYGSGHSIANLVYRVPKRATPSMSFTLNGGGAVHGTMNYLGNYIYWANTTAANSAEIVADAEL